MQVLLSILADAQLSGKAEVGLIAEDVLQKLMQMQTAPVPAENATELKKWKMRTPAYKAITEPDKEEGAAKGKIDNKSAKKKA